MMILLLKAIYIFSKRLTAFVCLLFLPFGLALGASDPYEVRVSLDVTGTSDEAAKREALDLAETLAFDVLLGRLLLREEGLSAAALSASDDSASLSLLIADLRLSDEQFGAGRYLADATVHFKRSELRRLFAARGLSYAETYSPRLLAIALQTRDDEVSLWGDSNIVLRALRRAPDRDGLLRYVVPYGDIEDIELLSIAQTRSERGIDFASIISRYGVGGVLLLRVTIDEGAMIVRAGGLASGRRWDFAELRYAIDEADADRHIEQATLDALVALQEAWKRQNLIRGGEQQILHAVMPISGLPAWYGALRRLRSVSVIDGVHPIWVSSRRAVVRIAFRSSAEQLQGALYNEHLRLDRRKSDGYWYIREL